MEKAVKIIFATGLAIDAVLNATTYVVDEKPDFPADLGEVTVEGEDGTTIFRNAEIVEAYSDDDKYRFAIREISADVIAQEKTDAQIMYTALMTDTLLEED